MKHFFQLLVLCSLSLFATSCQDDDPIWMNTGYTNRIAQATYYENGIEYGRDDFYYTGNFLTSISENQKGGGLIWQETEYTEIEYLEDEVYVSSFERNGNLWVRTKYAAYKVRNGQMMEEVQFEPDNDYQIPVDIWRYDYSKTKLTAWNHYQVSSSGVQTLVERGVYRYENGRLVEYSFYEDNLSGSLDEVEYTEFLYEGAVRTGLTRYVRAGNQWVNSYGEDYTYLGGRMTSLTPYFWNGNAWDFDGPATYYYYNAFGDLAEEISGTLRFVYDYEPGNGNAMFFWYYPEFLIKGQPVIKNATTSSFVPYYKRIQL